MNFSYDFRSHMSADDYRRVIIRWLLEETREGEVALSHPDLTDVSEYLDALFDALGVIIIALHIEDADAVSRAQADYRYAQAVRGRNLDMPHQAVIDRVVAELKRHPDQRESKLILARRRTFTKPSISQDEDTEQGGQS